MPEEKPRRPSLMPREHGAYAQVGFPLATALALGRFQPAQLLLAIGIIAVFLVHEPVLVMAGGRGGRAKRELGQCAQARAIFLLVAAVAAGTMGLGLTSNTARLAALVPLALAALLLPLTLRRQEKTLAGELLVSLTAAALLLPVALAGDVGLRDTFVAAAVWGVVFVLGTLTVRGLIAGAKRTVKQPWAPVVGPVSSALVIGIAVWLALSGRLATLVAAAVVPPALVALVFGALRVHPRHLKAMGWSFVVSDALALAALLVGLW